jgi:hypothetical protein
MKFNIPEIYLLDEKWLFRHRHQILRAESIVDTRERVPVNIRSK